MSNSRRGAPLHSSCLLSIHSIRVLIITKMARYSLHTASKKIRRLKATTRSLKVKNRTLKKKLSSLKSKMGNLEDMYKKKHASLNEHVTTRLAGIEERLEKRLNDDGPARLARRVAQRLDDMEEAYQQDLAALDARFTQRCNDENDAQDGEHIQAQVDGIETQLADHDRRLNEYQYLHSTAAVARTEIDSLANKVSAIEKSLKAKSSQASSAAAAGGPSTASSSSSSHGREGAIKKAALTLDKEARRRVSQYLADCS